MIHFLSQPWPWFIAGFIIAMIMLALIYWGRRFGLSSNLETLCSMSGLGKGISLFQFNWRDRLWNLFFLLGSVLGGFLAFHYLKDPNPIQLSWRTLRDLRELGIPFDEKTNPAHLFEAKNLGIKQISMLMGGGILIGFGTRYAQGCTSGHGISGLSNLQFSSFMAVFGFFMGGMMMTYFIFPLLF